MALDIGRINQKKGAAYGIFDTYSIYKYCLLTFLKDDQAEEQFVLKRTQLSPSNSVVNVWPLYLHWRQVAKNKRLVAIIYLEFPTWTKDYHCSLAL